MKRIILTLTIAILAIASFGQTYIVTTPTIPDSLRIEKRLVDISEGGIKRIERNFLAKIRKEDLQSGTDTVSCEVAMLIYIQSLWNKHNILEASYQTKLDSFTVIKINNNYYFDGDTTSLALNVERTAIIQLKAFYIEKYGTENILKYLVPEFEVKRIRLIQLNDWYNQILAQ